jgi:hypothetical protein
MKPIPLRPARRADSDHIFTFSNGLHMRELSHSDQILKQAKSQWSNWQKFNADVSMTSPSYFIMLTWQRQVATCDWAGDTGVDQ